MFKIYEKYLVKKFLKKFLIISLIFFTLTIILSIFEEISFLKNNNENYLVPYFLTFLNSPITLFEIFPFIFLLSTQFFFYEIFKNDELNLLKTNGLSNFRIIFILIVTSITVGIFTVLVYYNVASKLKFLYTDIKNNLSKDNKYLAVVTSNGLWLKDEIENNTFIIKAFKIKDDYLLNVIINQFDENFKLKRTIQSEKVDISKNRWIIFSPLVTDDNISKKELRNFELQFNFNKEKINNLFSNFATLNISELLNLKKEFEKLGYSANEISIHLLRLSSTPFTYALMTVLSAIIMFRLKKNNSLFFHLVLGVLISVLIYYFNFVFSSFGNTGKLPVEISIFLPQLIIFIIATIGLIRINEN